MPKSRSSKQATASELTSRLKVGRGVVFADFTGLSVKEMETLRRELRTAGVSYEVVKKTILRRSLGDAGFDGAAVAQLKGSVGVAVSEHDEVEPAKLLAAFAKTHEKLQFLGGLLEQKFVGVAMVQTLSQLPSKQELLAKLVGSIHAPVSGFVRALKGNLIGLVQVIRGMQNAKSKM